MMYFNWPRLQSSLTDAISINNHLVTLIEHDGPLLFVTTNTNKDTYFLNYLIDEDEDKDIRRFLHIQISHMKLRALVTQGITLYDCLNTNNLYIFDLDYSSEIILSAEINFEMLDKEALPASNELLPELSKNIVEALFGFESSDLCFILSGSNVEHHSMSFDKLSKYLNGAQKITSETVVFYCETNNLQQPIDTELRVTSHKAASFAINTYVKDNIVLEALINTLPKYTEMFLTLNSTEIYNILDEIPTSFAKSLFSYFNIINNNKFESIIKIKNKSFYLDREKIKLIKENIDNAKYIREEHINSTGYLIGGNIKTEHFYFIDKDTNETFRGHISEDYSSSHTTLTLSDTQLRKAKFKLSIKYKFNSFVQEYELLELTD